MGYAGLAHGSHQPAGPCAPGVFTARGSREGDGFRHSGDEKGDARDRSVPQSLGNNQPIRPIDVSDSRIRIQPPPARYHMNGLSRQGCRRPFTGLMLPRLFGRPRPDRAPLLCMGLRHRDSGHGGHHRSVRGVCRGDSAPGLRRGARPGGNAGPPEPLRRSTQPSSRARTIGWAHNRTRLLSGRGGAFAPALGN